MTDVKFSCPACQIHIAVDSSAIGQTVSCPNYGQAIVLSSATVAAADTLLATPAQNKPKRKTALLAAAALVVVLSLAGTAFLLFGKKSPFRKDRTASPWGSNRNSFQQDGTGRVPGPKHPSRCGGAQIRTLCSLRNADFCPPWRPRRASRGPFCTHPFGCQVLGTNGEGGRNDLCGADGETRVRLLPLELR